jgi:hypothetical protein
VESHRQGAQTGESVIFKKMRTLLARAQAVAPPPVSLPSFEDELGEVGKTSADWLADQRRGGRMYADINDEMLRRAQETYCDRAAETAAAAERALRHEFDFLGTGPFTAADPDRPPRGPYRAVDWRLDPIRGYRFPAGVPHAQWNFETMRQPGVDIKLPWELGRCQHFVTLGQAYRLTRDTRFAIEVFDQLEDFAEANPVGTGVQWTCTMDVAIRAANWTIALALVRACDAIDETRWLNAYLLLFDHGVFIENNLENRYEVTSNHFLSNIVGLYFVATTFAELSSGSRWLSRCREWLEQEMRTQVLDDGADYESSIPYHRLVTELFLSAARLASMHGGPLSSGFMERLKAMCSYLADVQRPDGLMPQVGDADDGRLHIFTAYGTWRPQDARHLLAPAAEMFGVAQWRGLAGDNGWEAAWWGFDVPAQPAHRSLRRAPLKHCPQAGVTVVETPRTYLLVTNGVVGTAGFGNHKHNDQLSFEYHVDGMPLVVDPGSGVYTSDPATRNYFRGTASHNTVMIDGIEQNEIKFEWLFRMFERSHPEHLRVEKLPQSIVYEGRHFGYERLPSPVIHRRRFSLDRETDVLHILDSFEGHGRHALTWHFHCAPGVSATATGGAIEIRSAAVRLRMSVPVGLKLTIDDAWYSPSYGVRIACRAINCSAEVQLDARAQFIFDLVPQ